jgi:hypothetical protein
VQLVDKSRANWNGSLLSAVDLIRSQLRTILAIMSRPHGVRLLWTPIAASQTLNKGNGDDELNYSKHQPRAAFRIKTLRTG